MAKFLVLWTLEQGLLSSQMANAVARLPAYGDALLSQGKVLAKYHVVGGHGGAWIYDVESNEELELLLAKAPVFNFARFDVRPLAEMAALPMAEH
ncbi:MAG: muconolactone Delta-isomerase family protein [Candidatus Methylomirabilales bacterium]